MEEQSAIHSTFVVEHKYPQTPERVFAAFADAGKKRRWFAEGLSHDLQEFELDFRVGGVERYRSLFKEGTPFPGVELTYEGSHHDIVPNRRIVIASTMSIGGWRISLSLVTVDLLRTDLGTDLICTNQGVYFEGSGGPKMREAGWRHLFEQLAKELMYLVPAQLQPIAGAFDPALAAGEESND
jgi:uncharacterized protein YndB with AHSA1/START domain